ncbi:MAG TPA: signal recognition particle receptor subunit alpha, partial [Halomicronema sp.]
MVFNWFRRQFDKTEETSEQPQNEPVQEQVIQESIPTEQEPAAVAEDYLSWAKAAYKNIQKQQQTTETETETETEPETEAVTEEVAAEETEIEETPTIVESPAPTETTVVSEMALPEPAEVQTPQIEEEIKEQTEETEPTSALPFWAKAEADRLERMERLKADAVEEIVEPEPTKRAPQMLSEEELAMLAFDEGFLWSAEILAAQGRRPDDVSIEEITWLRKLRQGLDKTRRNLINQLRAIVGQGPLNQAGVMEIESLLLQADVGVTATDFIINSLQNKLREEALPPEKAIAYLKQILREMLERPTGKALSVTFAPVKEELNIWLIVGVNGAGKTTTIGKIAHLADKSGYKTLIAAADTFRAAAVQQVKVWGSRSNVEVIANPGQNTDPAAVVFDAIAAAQARGTELLLVDTAGRLQN